MPNLQSFLAVVVSRSCAERLLFRSLKDALTAVRVLEQLEGEHYISAIQVEDGNKYSTVMRYIRWWTFFHELGHELFHTAPELVENIEAKIAYALEASGSRVEPEEITGAEAIDAARSRLKEMGVIQSIETRQKKILEALTSLRAREEIWCDVFAVEQLVLHAVANQLDPSEIYFALMLNHYINTIITMTSYYFDSGIDQEAYLHKLKLNKELEMRADVRVHYLMAILSELYIKPLDLDLYECEMKWIGAHYPALSRFAEIDRGILAIINDLNLREHMHNDYDRWYNGLSQEQRAEQNQKIRAYLNWNVPTL